MVGQYPLGGVAWDYFHYVLGLHELGHDVYYHEDTWVWPLDPEKGYPTDDPQHSVNIIKSFFDTYAPELANKWHYLLLHEKSFGMTRERFDEVARTADLFINVSGACFFPDNLSPNCIKVFLDTDPGYNQMVMHEKPAWSAYVNRWIRQVLAHDRHFTYAENIYGDDCIIPRMGIDWVPTRCVVTLPPWEQLRSAQPQAGATFTTVMSWSYFGGPLVYKGVEYGAKAPEYEKFHDLPKRVSVPLVLAVGGYHQNPERIKRDGWRWIDARPMSLTPHSYRQFIADSLAEWSIAKNCYVATRSGWFSCRTACYLAAGRPAVVQETGWSKFIPSSAGVLAFETMEQAIDGINRVIADPQMHRAAAYDIAREYLTPDRVLKKMIDDILSPPQRATS